VRAASSILDELTVTRPDALRREKSVAAAPGPAPPRTWLMTGHKDGDNAQIQGLCEALGWPFEIKRFVYRPTELLTNLALGPNLLGIRRRLSSALEPPWPELIISAGRRNEPVCRWIQARAAEAGVRTRLVHVGRSWARIELFDLIVTTPQYRVPDRRNVLQNDASLHRVTEERLEAEAAIWAGRLAHLPRPYVAVALGGRAGPYDLDPAAAALLGRWASHMAEEHGGSVLVTTSRRTPAESMPALRAAITAPSFIYQWSKDAREGRDNPYFGMLGLAERIIVTCDSMSMLAEACSTKKPVFIFDLDGGRDSHRPPWPAGEEPPRFRRPWWHRLRLQPLVYRIGMITGPKRLTRDVRVIHRKLIESGRAVWLGQDFPDRGERMPPLNDIERAVARVRALFADEHGAPAVATTGPVSAAAETKAVA
jgi:mitochondrial fission protein ELM1